MKPKRGSRFAVGIHACEEALRVRPHNVDAIYLKKQRSDRLQALAQQAERANVRIQNVDIRQLEAISPGHQGVAVEIRGVPEWSADDLFKRERALILGLDGLEDPQNLGAILRTAWLMGVDGVILSAHKSVGLTPAVHKVACGGVEHVPVRKINKFSDVAQDLKEAGYWIYGLSAEAKQTVWSYQPADKTFLILGSEEKGLRKTTANVCDDFISLPQFSKNASYNASVAAAMAIAETQRKRSVFSIDG